MKPNNRVWMLCHPDQGIWFAPPASSPAEAWDNAGQWEQWLHGGSLNRRDWFKAMRKDGWRAKRVDLVKYKGGEDG